MAGEHTHQIQVPRGILIAALILITVTITVVASFRILGVDPVAQIPDPEETAEIRELRFEDRPDGTVVVYDLSGSNPDRVIHVIEPGTGGFIRGVLRSLARARRAAGVGPEYPFQLIMEADGKMLLADPQTDRKIYIQAFGPTNVESFRSLLASEGIQ